MQQVRVGAPAPDFTGSAYFKGGFTDITMSEYHREGRWLLVCFYPGDFTFV